MLSIERQTNESIVGIDSEDFPSFSRNEPQIRIPFPERKRLFPCISRTVVSVKGCT